MWSYSSINRISYATLISIHIATLSIIFNFWVYVIEINVFWTIAWLISGWRFYIFSAHGLNSSGLMFWTPISWISRHQGTYILLLIKRSTKCFIGNLIF